MPALGLGPDKHVHDYKIHDCLKTHIHVFGSMSCIILWLKSSQRLLGRVTFDIYYSK